MSEALGPSDFPNDSDRIEDEVEEINDHLRKNPDKRRMPEFNVIIRDAGLTQVERMEVCFRFESAGWSHVISQTTAENGERPGLICYTFTKE